MRLVLFFIIALSNIILNAQPVRIGIVAQPALNYFTVQSDLSSLSQNFRQQIKPVVTLQGGLLLFKKLSPSVSFVSGLLLAQRGIRSQYNTSNITAFNFSNTGYDMKLIDRYIEVPLLLNIYLNKNSTVTWFGSFGLKPSVYINSVSKTIGSAGNYSSYYYAAHKKINLFVSLGFGAEIALGKKVSLIVWPSIDHALISEVYAAPLKLYPYSAGVNLCFVYSLGI